MFNNQIENYVMLCFKVQEGYFSNIPIDEDKY